MPRIKPAGEKQRHRYRKQLAEDQWPVFDRLTDLVTTPRADLHWYHEIGTLVRELLPAAGKHRERGAVTGLAKALGPSPSVFQKAARFAELYPSSQEVKPLERMGMDWTRLSLTFSVADEKARMQLLREAANDGWSIPRVRFEVQERHPSKRRGIGGRPRKKPEAYGPVSTLHCLKYLSEGWLGFYEEAWSTVKSRDWNRLVRDCPMSERETLRSRLEDTDGVLEKVAEACGWARQALAGLRRQVGTRGAKPAR